MTTNSAFKRNLLGAGALGFLLKQFNPRTADLYPARKVHKKTIRSRFARKYRPQTRRRTYSDFDMEEQVVQRMTNWQRTQWARARRIDKKTEKPIPCSGYPSQRAEEFASLKRPA